MASGAVASLDEAGYQAVAATRRTPEMNMFIHRVCQAYGWRVTDEGKVSGLAPYYSGERAVQSFGRLLDELRGHFGQPGAAAPVAPAPVASVPGYHPTSSSEQTFLALQARRDTAGMVQFLRNLVSTGGGHPSDGELSGLALYYSGERAAQTWQRLLEEITSKGWMPRGLPAVDQAAASRAIPTPGAPIVPPVVPGGTGFIGSLVSAVGCALASSSQNQRCFKCEGRGFCHESSMPHSAGHGDRCFFCASCSGCGGSGFIASAGSSAPVVPGFGGLGGQVQQRCFKCDGKGFCHDSSMPHSKPPGEKCFFCHDCSGCGGSGHIAGGSAIPAFFGIPAGGAGRCFKCEGRGFSHDSSMPHSKGPGERCFFCQDCSGCGGKGHI